MLVPLRSHLQQKPIRVPLRGPWPTELSRCIADGICVAKAHLLLRSQPELSVALQQMYPSVTSGPGPSGPEEAPGAPTEEWRKCPGCRGKQNRSDDRHNRIRGQCKFPDDTPHTWTCPGCKAHRPLGHPSHKMDETCKHVIVEARLGARRQGRHPRAPARRASASHAQDLQAQLPDGSDLAEAEEQAAAASQGGSENRPPNISDEDWELLKDMEPSPAEAPSEGEAHDADGEPCRGGPRGPRAQRDAGSGPELPSDWTRFDIGRSLRVLRVGGERAVDTELRKLHLRFWHAGTAALTQILRAAGLPAKVLDRVTHVVSTCKECRRWQRPAPATQQALSPSFKFNQHVEADLLFYKQYIVFHCICRTTRWHSATAVPNKLGETLYEAFEQCWVSIYGPPEQLILDGESGLWRPEVVSRLKRQGIESKIRAPQQHARYIERRGAILRATLHTAEDQLDKEDVIYTFTSLLSEAVFAGNACTHVGGVTPYQVVFGRQPSMLPPIEAPDLDRLEEVSEAGDWQRERVRAAALEAMIQATAAARLTRAARTRTSEDTLSIYKPDELVDIFRKPSSKDASGWSGPYKVVKVEPGQVVVNIRGTDRTYRAQDVRHSLLVFLTVGSCPGGSECMQIITHELQQLKPGQTKLFGFADQGRCSWQLTEATSKQPHVLFALEHLLTNIWRLGECCGARLSRGARHLAEVPRATHSTLLWWYHSPELDLQFGVADSTKVDLSAVLGKDYSRACLVQAIHIADEDVTLADAAEEAASHTHESLTECYIPDADHVSSQQAPSVHTPDGPLSAIAEEPEHADVEAFLAQVSPCSDEVREALREVFAVASTEVLEEAQYAPQEASPCMYMHPTYLETPAEPLCQYVALGIDPKTYGRLNERDELGNGFIELWFARDFAKVIGDEALLGPEETHVLRVYASGYRNAVIQRDSDLLTSSEMQQHRTAVSAAILEELKIWERYKCFRRVSRKSAHNVMDSKFVAKWKVIKDDAGADKRIIRMRLALRGFKDLQAAELEAHAATASRQSQRCLCSEAALHPEWKFIALDINKAFLQGLTYREIHDLTGEAEREVCFTLPPGTGELLKQLPGYEGYDERTEVLQCIKPGTGCKDAPRAFSLKLARYTRDPKIGLEPTLYDSELEVKFREGRIVLMLAKHVDDLKVAGEPQEVDRLIQHLESGFGKLAYSEKQFTNCGLRHTRMDDGSIQMDQDEYISAMKQIRHPELTGRSSSEPCSVAVHGLYQSLLGAVAYALLSQSWAAVFVISLQRRTSNPLNIHVRRLNLLLASMQKLKCKLVFPNMQCEGKIAVFSDASFDKESESKGYGMRGTILLRLGRKEGRPVCHLLDAQSQSLKLVTRSTFASETLAAVGSVDSLVPWLYTFEELKTGVLTSQQARTLREQGGFAMSSELHVDAMNLYQALTAQYPKPPAEKTLFTHIAWLRDLLSLGIPRTAVWVDTRDMYADGLTKGKISRDALLELMQGKYAIRYPSKRFSPLSKHAPHTHSLTNTPDSQGTSQARSCTV
eukprot:s2398_g6.t1